ncbi:hypothetical protein D9M68_832400 [compost metagenome]
MRLMPLAASVAQVWVVVTMSASRPLIKSLLKWMVLKLAATLLYWQQRTVLTFLTQHCFAQAVLTAVRTSCFQSEKTVKLF